MGPRNGQTRTKDRQTVNDSNMIHVHEREEYRDAIQYDVGSCYRHHYVSDRRGGGTCTACGDSIGADEL